MSPLEGSSLRRFERVPPGLYHCSGGLGKLTRILKNRILQNADDDEELTTLIVAVFWIDIPVRFRTVHPSCPQSAPDSCHWPPAITVYAITVYAITV